MASSEVPIASCWLRPEHNRGRNEEDAAADTEHAGEHARDEAERDCERICHLTNSQTATASMKPAKSNSTVRVRRRCCSAVAKATEPAAGSPTSAA